MSIAVELTPVHIDHVPALLRFERSNADYFAQFVPKRPLKMLTDKGMAAAVKQLCHEAETGQGAYFVVLKGDEVIARLNLVFDGEQADIGYRVGESHAGQGIATQMVQCALDWLKEEGFDVATAHALSSNPGSVRVLEKCGFGVNRVDQDGGAAFGFDGDVAHFEQMLIVEPA
ncbi:GNAT family N-acetyltransferase [Maritalea mediterranea]|uniref:GNAT family N-acetyltransferase n=1 Tax=Maritalea mediterranea TaxID=2909667 RepID=A0ABS9E830_9HYPH|nr:GNAT family N-acetyltransferase [Maritalea mediterranea]MCF4099002.1 GNAT family N-acetyltransferase [Maritalea mediterranea]